MTLVPRSLAAASFWFADCWTAAGEFFARIVVRIRAGRRR